MSSKTHKKRSYRRKRKPFNATKISGVMLGNSKRVTLKFGQVASIDAGVGAMGGFAVAASNPHAAVSSGHDQPRGFDQLMALYDHFVVMGAKAKFTFCSQSDTTLTSLVGVSLADSNAIQTSALEVLESRQTRTKCLSTRSAGDAIQTIWHSYNAAKFFNVKDPKGKGSLLGTASSSPSDNAYWIVQAGAADGSSDIGVVPVIIEVWYDILLLEPKTPATS